MLENKTTTAEVTVQDLLAHKRIELGIYRAHRFYVALESVANDKFLDDLTGPVAVLVSHFVSEGSVQDAQMGSLARAVEARLGRIDAELGHQFTNWILTASRHRAADALDVPLKLSGNQRSRIGFDRIILITFESGPTGGRDADAVTAKAVIHAFSLAARAKLSHFIIPCIGYNWEDNSTIELRTFFDLVFNSVPPGAEPDAIHFSLYSNWPNFALETAVAAINATWRSHEASSTPWGQIVFYRADVRSTLLLMSLCLFASLAFTQATMPSVVIIAVAYFGVVAAADAPINLFLTDADPNTILLVKIVVRVVLAVGFPVIIRWKVEDLFRSRHS
jgi:hypothetical protein